MEKEIWKDIPGYEGYYQASTNGRIRSTNRSIYDKNGNIKHLKSVIINQSIKDNGYMQVNLSKNNKSKTHTVHRLIAITFLENKNNLPEINHKDENKQNNTILNLEWCDHSYNMLYLDNFKKRYKKVNKFSLNGNFLSSYESIADAARLNNCDKSAIVSCCKGFLKTHKGFIWKYAN